MKAIGGIWQGWAETTGSDGPESWLENAKIVHSIPFFGTSKFNLNGKNKCRGSSC